MRLLAESPPNKALHPSAPAAITSLRLTLADLVRAHGDAYRRAHRLARVQTLALRAIAACRAGGGGDGATRGTAPVQSLQL